MSPRRAHVRELEKQNLSWKNTIIHSSVGVAVSIFPTSQPNSRRVAQDFYEAVRNDDVDSMERIASNAADFSLTMAQSFSPVSLPEYAIEHKAPHAAWWLLGRGVCPESWKKFAGKVGVSFFRDGLKAAQDPENGLSLRVYFRLASKIVGEASGKLRSDVDRMLHEWENGDETEKVRTSAAHLLSEMQRSALEYANEARQKIKNFKDREDVQEAVATTKKKARHLFSSWGFGNQNAPKASTRNDHQEDQGDHQSETTPRRLTVHKIHVSKTDVQDVSDDIHDTSDF